MTAERLADGQTAVRMIEVRCRTCGRLLFKADAVGKIETVCPERGCRRYQAITLPSRPI